MLNIGIREKFGESVSFISLIDIFIAMLATPLYSPSYLF
jgi:hypothetical protein